MSSLRFAYAGTPEFASQALQALIAAGFVPSLVLTQPDRPAGRGLREQASAVKQLALTHQIPVLQPHGLRLNGKFAEQAQSTQEAMQALGLDVLIVAAYGLILPAWVLEMPRFGCLNIHASLLPRWRGAAPIHRAIEAGDAQTGISIMQMDEGLDTGAIVSMDSLAIEAMDTTGQLHDRLAVLGGQCIVQAMNQLQQTHGLLPSQPQPAEGVTYAEKIKERPRPSIMDAFTDAPPPTSQKDEELAASRNWIYGFREYNRYYIVAVTVNAKGVVSAIEIVEDPNNPNM